jgi:hypothetical protein
MQSYFDNTTLNLALNYIYIYIYMSVSFTACNNNENYALVIILANINKYQLLRVKFELVSYRTKARPSPGYFI